MGVRKILQKKFAKKNFVKNFFAKKNFFSSVNMYQAKSGVKHFSLGGGSLCENFFFQSEHVSSQIWCQKFFPLLAGRGGSLCEKFFSQSEHVSSQIWCQKIFPLLGGGCPSEFFFFFPV